MSESLAQPLAGFVPLVTAGGLLRHASYCTACSTSTTRLHRAVGWGPRPAGMQAVVNKSRLADACLGPCAKVSSGG